MFRQLGPVFLAALAFFCVSVPRAYALTPHETLLWDGMPSPDLVAEWSSLPGTRTFLFQNADPFSTDLDTLAKLRGADSIQVEVTRIPGDDSVAAWKKLADQGAVLIGFDTGIPTDDEIRRINAIGFSRVVLVLTGYPGPEEAARLAAIRASVALTFAVAEYPRFEDRDGLRAIPAAIPLLFSNDYWPWYTHMDLFNMIPQALRLRVSGSFPPDEEVQYLRNIQRLRDLTIETGADASEAGAWDVFDRIPVTWSNQDRVPSPEGLAAFEKSALLGTHMPRTRRLTIDMDRPLTENERALLTGSRLPVEWIHLAPSSYLARRH